MKKSLRSQKNYPNNENDNDDYYYPSSIPFRQSTSDYSETYTQPSVSPPQQQQPQQPPTQSTQKYCFL